MEKSTFLGLKVGKIKYKTQNLDSLDTLFLRLWIKMLRPKGVIRVQPPRSAMKRHQPPQDMGLFERKVPFLLYMGVNRLKLTWVSFFGAVSDLALNYMYSGDSKFRII